MERVLYGDVVEVERDEDGGYEVEFAGPAGTVEVRLDRNLEVAGSENEAHGAGGSQLDRARAAARDLAAFGDIVEVEREDDRDPEEREAYEVEFLRPDGTSEEVELDRDLNPLPPDSD